MSSLTLCNHCALKRIERAEARNDESLPVTTRPVLMPDGIEYWMGVFIGADAEPVALFHTLTTHCVC